VYKSQSSESIDTECRATLKSALQLAAEGILVFPLKRNSKEPEPRSRGFKDATANPALIRRWFDNDYGRNLAIRTGSVSGVFVVDADNFEALENFSGALR
jgi:hypothetical protein